MRASALKSRTKWDPDPNCSRTETTWPPPRCSSVARRLRLETLPPASRSEHGRRRRVGRLSPRGRGHSRLQPGSPTRGAVRPPGPPRWGQGLLQHPPPHPGLASPHPVYLRDGSPRPRPEVRTRRFPARRRQEGVSPQRGQVGPFHRLPRPARLTPTGERGTAGPQRRRRFPPRRLPLAGSNRSVPPPPPFLLPPCVCECGGRTKGLSAAPRPLHAAAARPPPPARPLRFSHLRRLASHRRSPPPAPRRLPAFPLLLRGSPRRLPLRWARRRGRRAAGSEARAEGASPERRGARRPSPKGKPLPARLAERRAQRLRGGGPGGGVGGRARPGAGGRPPPPTPGPPPRSLRGGLVPVSADS